MASDFIADRFLIPYKYRTVTYAQAVKMHNMQCYTVHSGSQDNFCSLSCVYSFCVYLPGSAAQENYHSKLV